jgi:3-deoxy-D-manno-octulosonate 8-phosphate phosphatase (KDO 8-P phosphatase)
MNYKTKLTGVKLFAFDYDGIFTDGTVLLMPGGIQVRNANVKDGFAVQWAIKQGLELAIISGGREETVVERMMGLGVRHIFMKSHDKIAVLHNLCAELDIALEDVAYMGDDMPDVEVLKAVGLATCPSDAVAEVREVCDYVSPQAGGKGCVRDLLEQAMKARGLWLKEGVHNW